MTGAEREHLLALKVMRLTKPMLARANNVSLDGRDIEAYEDPFSITNKDDVNLIDGTPYESSSPLVLLPQSFGNIFLGETFSSYISVHNPTKVACRNVNIKIELQTNNNRFNVASSRASSQVAEIPPGQSCDDIISHEVKELGAAGAITSWGNPHKLTTNLVCTVNYSSPINQRMELRKFYKFQVLKPLELKTKFLDSETGEVYLEAQIQNITPNGVYLERVTLDPAPNFTCEDLSRVNCGDPFERYVNPMNAYQFLFRISPMPSVRDNPKLLKSSTAMGRLDIQWTSYMGEKGRLQTSPLQRLVPGSGDVKLTVKSMKSTVKLETPVNITFQLVNTSERNMDLKVELTNNPASGILWEGLSGRQIGMLAPSQSIVLNYTFIPIRPGLQTVSGIKITDAVQKRLHEFDGVAHLIVE